MDYYTLGVELGEGATVGAILEYISPGTTDAKLDEIDQAARALNNDVEASQARAMFKVNWRAWYKDVWQKFFTNNRTGVLAGASKWFSANIYDQALEMQKKLVDWQNAYKIETGQDVSNPTVAVEKPAENGGLFGAWNLQKIAIVGGLVIVGGVIVYGLGRYAIDRLMTGSRT